MPNIGKADSGIIYVVVILATLIAFSFYMSGGTLPSASYQGPPRSNPGEQEIVFEQVPDPKKKNLQLQTFKVKNSCESTIAVDFLIDVSGSMGFGNKLNEEKAALQAFTNRMLDDSVMGIQTFSAGTNEIVPISLYKDIKPQVQNAILSLYPRGNTQTRDGLTLSRDKLSEVISQNKFSDRKYSLVLITDGIPETSNEFETDCLAASIRDDGKRRCFARAQDPRGTSTDPTNIATDIKNLGVEVYSINITSTERSDVELGPQLEALLKDVASPPTNEHYFVSLNGTNLTQILDKVFKDICK